MSTAILRSPEPESPYVYLVKRTVEACRVAKEAAATAAEGIATASCPLLSTLREREKELDRLDMEIDAGVTQVITQVTESEARELLACMKFMISLERIGDLLLSFAGSAQAVCARIEPQDIRDLTHMATVLEKMLLPSSHRKSRKPAAPSQFASHLHDPIARARRRSCQEPG